MTRAQLIQRISIDPRICFGKPCIRGTRIWVALIVDNLAEGVSEAELLAAYPQLHVEDIRAALGYAAEMTRERIIPIPVEAAPHMRFKLDENFDARLVPLLADAGHDVDTVVSEGLSGKDDDAIYEACKLAKRALMTLDLDFSNPFRFPPEDTEGIVVVRPPRALLPAIRATLISVLPQFQTQDLKGNLWIVEPGRIPVHERDESSGLP